MATTQNKPSEAAKRLKEIRTRAGLSMKEVAEAFGWSITRYQHYEDRFKKSALPLEMSDVLMSLFTSKGIPKEEVMDLFIHRISFTPKQYQKDLNEAHSLELKSENWKIRSGSDYKNIYDENVKNWQAGVSKDIPVYKSFNMDDSGRIAKVSIIDWSRLPELGEKTSAYGIYVESENMSPRYIPGEIAYAHPGRPLTSGCFVIAWIYSEKDPGTLTPLVYQYMMKIDNNYTLLQYKPSREIQISTEKMGFIHRIILSGER